MAGGAADREKALTAPENGPPGIAMTKIRPNFWAKQAPESEMSTATTVTPAQLMAGRRTY